MRLATALVAVTLTLGVTATAADATSATNLIAANKLAANLIAANLIAANKLAANKLAANAVATNGQARAKVATDDHQALAVPVGPGAVDAIVGIELPDGTSFAR
jgi:hypothetical protein